MPEDRAVLPSYWRVSLLTALAYLAAGKLGLLLAIPPGYASPLYPSAGIALAAVLVFGRRALPGVALGSLLMNASLGAPRDGLHGLALGLPLVSSLGATLQAGLGALLMRRWLRGPLVLGEPREVVVFFGAGAALACSVNASLSTAALVATGVVPAAAQALTWWTWWAGDTLGVLIGTPIALTVIGRPRADWVPRRVTLALPLLATTALLATGSLLVSRWDTERSLRTFQSDAKTAGAAMATALDQSLYALEALHGLHIGSETVRQDEMQRASAPWLDLPIRLQALGYGERVPRSALARYEAEVSLASGAPYRVFDRSQGGQASLAARDPDVVAIRFLEPRDSNASALGVNSMSVPAAREAIERALRSNSPAATAGFRLTQEAGDQTGVVIYRALYQPTQAGIDAAARLAAFRGVVFVTLRMQQSAESAMRGLPGYLNWCLIDPTPGATRAHLAGPPGCERAALPALVHDHPVQLGGQRWVFRLAADQASMPDGGYGNTWMFSVAGLFSAAMLAALLLTVTGRTRRIEAAVAARTADLQREVAERQRTEAALRESEQRLRSIVDHAPVGMAFADLQGHLRETNPKLRQMLGQDAQALSHLSVSDLAHADDRAAIEQDLQRLARGELAEIQRITRLRRSDGQTVQVRTHWSLLRGPDAQQDRLVAVIEDITEQSRREAAEQGRRQAEAANQAKNDFLSRMSHELRTPLNAMLGFAQLLEMGRLPALAPQQQGWAGQIVKAGWHLLAMINDMLDLSRIDAGMVRVSSAPVELAPLVAHCVAMAGPAAAQREISFEVRLPAEASQVQGDETRIKQVMSNLLSNAVKYNRQGGRVSVSAQALPGQRLQLRVQDTGAGLTPTQQANLFQPFNRLGRELTATEGTGIGLVISQRLAELMGGSLQVESSAGEGATFVLTLPRPKGDPPAVSAQQAPPLAEGLRYPRRKLHYIEDNETNIEVMRGMLLQRPQLSLTVSMLGLDGLQAVRKDRPDLILLDMHLPDMDGLELLHQFQRDPACAGIPVVMVSADATASNIQQALAAGARHYLTKPLELAPLLALLDLLLGGPDSQPGSDP